MFSLSTDILSDPFIDFDSNDFLEEEDSLSTVFEDYVDGYLDNTNYSIGLLKQPEFDIEDYLSNFDFDEDSNSIDNGITDSTDREDNLNLRFSNNLNLQNSNSIFNLNYNELPFYKIKSPYFFDLQFNATTDGINNIKTIIDKNIGFSQPNNTRDYSKRFIILINWLNFNINDSRILSVILKRLDTVLKSKNLVNKVINPFGKKNLSGTTLEDFLYTFKIPYIQNYNNNIIYLLRKKQNEFKYTLYKKIILNILIGDFNNFNILKKIYKNLETQYLYDTYKIIALSRLGKKIPIDGLRLNSNSYQISNNDKNFYNFFDINMLVGSVDELLKIKNKNNVFLNKKNKTFSLLFNIKNLKNWDEKKKLLYLYYKVNGSSLVSSKIINQYIKLYVFLLNLGFKFSLINSIIWEFFNNMYVSKNKNNKIIVNLVTLLKNKLNFIKYNKNIKKYFKKSPIISLNSILLKNNKKNHIFLVEKKLLNFIYFNLYFFKLKDCLQKNKNNFFYINKNSLGLYNKNNFIFYKKIFKNITFNVKIIKNTKQSFKYKLINFWNFKFINFNYFSSTNSKNIIFKNKKYMIKKIPIIFNKKKINFNFFENIKIYKIFKNV